MITAGSISREEATLRFDFLQEKMRGRRAAINEFTHRDPDFVFWIYPNGRIHDARDAHIKNYPKGHAHILRDKPDYGGFLRGRIATKLEHQLVVVYCRPEALYDDPQKIRQFLNGIYRVPVPLDDDALVASDNADIYGTIEDITQRLAALESEAGAKGL